MFFTIPSKFKVCQQRKEVEKSWKNRMWSGLESPSESLSCILLRLRTIS